jgi:hypothetical protein
LQEIMHFIIISSNKPYSTLDQIHYLSLKKMGNALSPATKKIGAQASDNLNVAVSNLKMATEPLGQDLKDAAKAIERGLENINLSVEADPQQYSEFMKLMKSYELLFQSASAEANRSFQQLLNESNNWAEKFSRVSDIWARQSIEWRRLWITSSNQIEVALERSENVAYKYLYLFAAVLAFHIFWVISSRHRDMEIAISVTIIGVLVTYLVFDISDRSNNSDKSGLRREISEISLQLKSLSDKADEIERRNDVRYSSAVSSISTTRLELTDINRRLEDNISRSVSTIRSELSTVSQSVSSVQSELSCTIKTSKHYRIRSSRGGCLSDRGNNQSWFTFEGGKKLTDWETMKFEEQI